MRNYLDSIRAPVGSAKQTCPSFFRPKKKGEPQRPCTAKCLPGQGYCGRHVKVGSASDATNSESTTVHGDIGELDMLAGPTVEEALASQMVDVLGDEEGESEV